MKDEEKLTRRDFLKKGRKLIYLTPVIHTFFTGPREAAAAGQRAAQALQQRVNMLDRAARAGNTRAQQAVQNLRARLVSPP